MAEIKSKRAKEMEEMLDTLYRDSDLVYELVTNMAHVIGRIEEIAKKIDVKKWKGVSTLINLYKSYKERKFTYPGNNVTLTNVEKQLQILHAILTDDKLSSNDKFEKWSIYSVARLHLGRVKTTTGAAQDPNE
jgi:hypothetical protein